jgi:chondroitin AC lyase
MKKSKLLIFIFFVFFTVQCSAQSFLGTLEKNIEHYYQKDDSGYNALDRIIINLQQDPDAVDMVTKEVYQKKTLEVKEVDKLFAGFDLATGKWSDINYNDKRESGWDPKIHTERILLLTSLYTDPQSIYYHKETFKNLLHSALKFWFDAHLTCKNWWYNEIGIPKTLGPVFIMLRDELSADEIKQAVIVLNHSTFKMTGQNKVWLAGNVLFKAILIKDESLAKSARDTIFSELKISGAEGIQIDNSFHQHGPQQQFGNYGLSFVNTLSFWSRVFSGTSLQIDNEHIAILRNLMLQGYSWITWKGFLDINSFGRQFFKGVDRSKALAIAYSMLDMTFVDPANANLYKAFISRNYGAHYISKLNGTKYFWRSDMTVHRSANWFATLKMSSIRVQATEALNRENLKGYFLGDGNYFVSVDGDEYEGIFPYLNWEKLPGVTNFQTPEPIKVLGFSGYRNKGDFTGGVVSGNIGISAFQLNRDSLTGNKAYFWINDKLICLGAAINSDLQQPIFTTINQTKLKGPVYFNDGNIKELKDTTFQSKSIKWVYHNKIGYYNLQPSNITISSKNQTGSWGDIAFVYDKEKPITKPVFTLDIAHNISSKINNYAYALFPDVTLDRFKTVKPDFTIVKNNKQVQAIATNNGAILMLAVYEPIAIQIKSFPALKFTSPGLYIVEKSKNGWLVSISDPTQKLQNAVWEIGGKKQLTVLPKDLNKGETTQININLN